MAQIGISEFTFGYAFLFEQTQANWAGLTAAPVLPSLQEEGEQGWDAHLPLDGTDFYYQFKLSDYLQRMNATYLDDGTYSSPYYRIWLHRRNNSQQHRRLKRLAASSPNTYYVAPEFDSIDQFNTSFLARQVSAACRIIPVQLCDDIADDGQHCITFQKGIPAWDFHSERRRHERSYTGKEAGELYRGTSNRWQRIDRNFAEALFERTREMAKNLIAEETPADANLVGPLLNQGIAGKERSHLLLRTADILSATLGVTLVLVGSRQ